MPTPGTPIRSMTGFATAAAQAPNGPAVSLTIKSVNHRFLDLRLHLPSGSDLLEQRLRTAIRDRIHRGHVELTLTSASDVRQASGLRLNDDTLAAYLHAFAQAAQTHGLSSPPDLNDLLRLPGVMTTEAPAIATDRADLDTAVLAALPTLLDRFDIARAQEGAALGSALRISIAHIQQWTSQIADLRRRVKPAHLDRLRARMAELLSGASVSISEERLLAEAALLAERSDIEEETVRLHAHAERFLSLLDAGGEVGKRLDFLLQEFGREANTILSKTGSAAGPESLHLTELGLEIKAEIERIREQVQNLE